MRIKENSMRLLLSAALAGVLALPAAQAQEAQAPAPAASEPAPGEPAVVVIEPAPVEPGAPAAAPAGEAPAEGLEPVAPAEGVDAARDAEAEREAEAEATIEESEDADGIIEGPAPGEAPQASSGTEEAVAGADAEHAEEEHHGTPHYPINKPRHVDWSFAGPFGHWDIGQLQRGLKIYREVCAACHGLDLVAFRNLEDLGYSDPQVRAFAAEYQIEDPLPNAEGEMFERPGIPSDRFPNPYANPQQAAASNGGAVPPDLSLMAKARAVERGFPLFVFDIFTQYAENGPDYIYSLLTGYGQEAPAHYEIQPGTHYNPYFTGGIALAMAAPLSDDVVTYDDGAPQTVDQYARDVSAFLMWAAEPHLVERKATGFVVMLFLIVFGGLVYGVKRKVWASTPH